MGNFYQDVIVKDHRFHSVQPINDLMLLEPNMRRKVLAILDESKKQGHPLYVFETYRSTDRQLKLYEQGATQLKKVGVHHYGLACDLVQKNAKGEYDWNMNYNFLGMIAGNHGLVWGGSWRFKDVVHVQWLKVGDQTKLFNGSFYPDNSYNAVG